MMSTAAAADKDISRTQNSHADDGGGEEEVGDDASISSDTSDDDEGEIYGQDMGSRFSFKNGFVSLNQETLLKLQKDDPAVTKVRHYIFVATLCIYSFFLDMYYNFINVSTQYFDLYI